jgi:ankyrin repeat protein
VTGSEQPERHRRFAEISAAFRGSDVAALRAALGDPDDFPNNFLPLDVFGPAGMVLEYAIYHSPLPMIRALVESGADLNPPDGMHAGFPPLLATLSKLQSASGSPARPDALEVLRLLLDAGADPNQRGLNDWTALHMAVAERSLDAVRILLDAGADPTLRTRIDDCESPLEGARQAGLTDITLLLEAHEVRPS